MSRIYIQKKDIIKSLQYINIAHQLVSNNNNNDNNNIVYPSDLIMTLSDIYLYIYKDYLKSISYYQYIIESSNNNNNNYNNNNNNNNNYNIQTLNKLVSMENQIDSRLYLFI
jgi:hypothetical protein